MTWLPYSTRDAVRRLTRRCDAPLRLGPVKTSCGCTAAVYSTNAIEPGEYGKIGATMTVSNSPGVTSQNIILSTNDRNAKLIRLSLKADVAWTPRIYPSRIYQYIEAGRAQMNMVVYISIPRSYDPHTLALEAKGISATFGERSVYRSKRIYVVNIPVTIHRRNDTEQSEGDILVGMQMANSLHVGVPSQSAHGEMPVFISWDQQAATRGNNAQP